MGTINSIDAGTGIGAGKFTGGVVVGKGVSAAVGVGSGAGITYGVQGIACCRILLMVKIALVVPSPYVKNGNCILGLFSLARMSLTSCCR